MSFEIVEATIPEIQAALEAGEITSKQLVLMYYERIADHDKNGLTINSVLEINPDALFIAESLDVERTIKGSRGPLHGIPVLLKDNINTGDKMHTSAGSLALANSFAGEDAFIVTKLREAGAIIMGKANMTEFANFMTNGMPSGYSSRGGQVLNPYNISTPTGGSSAGSAVAAACNFCTVSVGTETSGSILNPGNLGSIIGIKPTVGLLSRSGILPLSNTQDTAGPMARTVRDAVLLLNAMLGNDTQDAAMGTNIGRIHEDYTVFLDENGLQGARIGIPRDYYFEELTEEQLALFNASVDRMRELGATIIDPTDIKTAREISYSSVVLNEFKTALNAYLSRLGPGAPMRTLKDIIDFNHAHPVETLRYGQATLIDAEYTSSGTQTEPKYLLHRATDLKLCKEEGIDATMKEHNLDALLFPADFGARITSRAGYPSIVVPSGYTSAGAPFGVTFSAKAYQEPTLIKLAYAYEQNYKMRKAPSLKSFI
ncbi:amidase family protein [Paenibacillus pseudetheri]|uniref:Glutamyl-tRNA(Gln) amidotransferase subunit A, chloroplastic/mitochondrial n=1 Tax=Paenibacillus pseudetheri TaxID=2897682 RepID=A0ABN8FL50_9BACL|nr:amidase family protein [Paenibacillus pseudetheri]CAH1056495.1 Glutamyl-tRNA(Gln) amidotransferase subunit A, chloroplastic/mitochondrial [Paenibacillus pseudetheri]